MPCATASCVCYEMCMTAVCVITLCVGYQMQRRLLSEVNLHVTLTEVLTVAQSVERAQKELKEIHLSEVQSENHSVH